MKRHGQLLARIADPANLRLAFWKAAKGKRAKADCRAFQENLDANLSALRAEVLAGEARAGDSWPPALNGPCKFPNKNRLLHSSLFLTRGLST